jgi:hypothetical protein
MGYPKMQYIEDVTGVLIAPDTVAVSYFINGLQNNLPALPLEIQAFWSSSSSLESVSNSPLASPVTVISDTAQLTPGKHTVNLPLYFTPPADTSGVQNLVVAVDPNDRVLMLNQNTRSSLKEWVYPQTKQVTYFGVPPKGVHITLTNPKGWTREAQRRAAIMRAFLGPRHLFAITAIIKPGPHSKLEKMDVAPLPGTGWEQLALAAASAGFWVHAEGIRLVGKYWPPTPGSKPHLDLYNIQPASRK